MCKSIKLTNEVSVNLVSSLSAFKSDANKIRFNIGIKPLGNNWLASKAIIVNGGCMAEIKFAVIAQDSNLNIPEGSVLMSFILSASEFCSYLSALNSYNADITITLNGSIVELSIGDNVKVPLNTVAEEQAEPMLMKDYNEALIRIQADKDFIPTLSKGGFLVSPKTNLRYVTDRVILRFADKDCFIYSSDCYSVSKAWCPCIILKNDPQRALHFLREKGKEPDKLDKEELVELAKKEGFDNSTPVSIGIPAAAFNTIQKIFSGFEKLYLIVTPKYLHINGGNIVATFSLAGDIPNVYKETVDCWEKTKWSAKAVTDRDAFLRSLQLLKLGDKTVPFKLNYDSNGLSLSQNGTVIHTTVTATEGDIASADIALIVERVCESVSKLSAGNIVIRMMTGEQKNSLPISISNGDLSETVTSYAYILTVYEKKQNKGTEANKKTTPE